MSELVTVTRKFINSGGTPTGRPGCFAWTSAQHKILGTFPPRRGWMEMAIGRKITREAADAFLTIARRQKGLSKKAKRKRNAALRSLAWTLQEPIEATPLAEEMRSPARKLGHQSLINAITVASVVAQTDTACPICHGDDLQRLSCPLCAGSAIEKVDDPWQALEEIASDASRKPSAAAARHAITQAATVLRHVTESGRAAPREIAITTQLVRALELCAQHDEAGA